MSDEPKDRPVKKKTVKKAAKNKDGKPAKKVGKKTALAAPVEAVEGLVAGRSISRNEIYHRLEWYLDRSHDPHGSHSIDPNTPIDSFFEGMDGATGREILYVNLNKVSSTFFPAWQSALFHGIQFPWTSKPPIAIGLRDVQTFGNLIDSTALTYRHFGWHVN